MTWFKNALLMLGFLALGLSAGLLVRSQLQAPDGGVDVRSLDRAAAGVAADDGPIMLSLSTCPVCTQARAWLDQRRIAHREMVIDQSEDAQRLADRLGLDAVPVFLIGDKQVTGFDPALLESLLDAVAASD